MLRLVFEARLMLFVLLEMGSSLQLRKGFAFVVEKLGQVSKKDLILRLHSIPNGNFQKTGKVSQLMMPQVRRQRLRQGVLGTEVQVQYYPLHPYLHRQPSSNLRQSFS